MNRRFSQASLFAGVGALLVLVGVIVGAFALGMLPQSGDAAVGSNQIAFVSYRDGDAEFPTGFATSWSRERRTDINEYEAFKRQMEAQKAG